MQMERLPFGLPDGVLEGLHGPFGAGNNTVEAGKGNEIKFYALIQRCREGGIEWNKNKVKYSRPTQPQLGHLVTSSGLKPDPDKFEAIQKMPRPEYVKGVRRVCIFVSTWPHFC